MYFTHFKYLDNLVFQRLQVLLFFNRPRTLSTIRGIGEIEQSDVSFPVSESVDFNANVVTWESQLMRLLWTTVSYKNSCGFTCEDFPQENQT
ncbi:hypothetical protein CA2559_00350 [Croceibacter atlanticus HTCC2559]|uniref:Uncharacterized protein n=1 Tax=Croceibacter atlanticus (strain ATCC BAA-628 / JCM 21780 / CIP 108009 / IAM 15332 / KCTC 12090 / HTCC2559) TaxID=216432 RepID=A3U4J2_CROAH|nr:hypothetical protein CA2559_00350 [Croceibacter atlanticus HTCC2559]